MNEAIAFFAVGTTLVLTLIGVALLQSTKTKPKFDLGDYVQTLSGGLTGIVIGTYPRDPQYLIIKWDLFKEACVTVHQKDLKSYSRL